MTGGSYSQSLYHLIKAFAVFGLGVAAVVSVSAAIVQFESMDLDPESISALTTMFNFLGICFIAVFWWAIVEFLMAVWTAPAAHRTIVKVHMVLAKRLEAVL